MSREQAESKSEIRRIAFTITVVCEQGMDLNKMYNIPIIQEGDITGYELAAWCYCTFMESFPSMKDKLHRDSWRLEDGQERTECPKGLLSSKMIPCNGCLGRCVNIHAGRSKYYKRTPVTPTLINGESVGQWGTQLKIGDVITVGEVTINVR